MARIRTVKPELFKHEELYELEQEHKLPLRLAFIGLWCVCDREGRFKWRPNQLKIEILPYDKIDFSRVLDALATREFVVEYTSDTGERYGYVPTFTDHQVINNRESQSQLLCPFDACATRDPRGLSMHKGKGKERKGKEGKGRERNISHAIATLAPLPDWIPRDAWDGYCAMRGKSFTPHAKDLAIAKLEKFRNEGFNPREVLENSIMHGWKGLFEPQSKGNRNENTGRNHDRYSPPGKSQQAADAISKALDQLDDDSIAINALYRHL